MTWDSQVFISQDQRSFSQVTLRELKERLDAGAVPADMLLCRDSAEGWLALKDGLAAVRSDLPEFPEYANVGWRPPPPPPPVAATPVTPPSVAVEHAEPVQIVHSAPPTEATRNEGLGCFSVVRGAVGLIGGLISVLLLIAVVIGVIALILGKTKPTPEQHLEAIVMKVPLHDIPALPYVSQQWAAIYYGALAPFVEYEDAGIASYSEIRAPDGTLLVSTTGVAGNVEVTIHTKKSVATQLLGNGWH